MTKIEGVPFSFSASDAWLLTGDLFVGEDPKCAVIISSGTGFPSKFYRHAASWFAERGAVVLSYDYRGIGNSAPKSLKHSEIDYPDWGFYDLPAAVDAIQERYPGLPITHIAHSVGGHFIGLMPNYSKILRHAFVSVGTGYFGRHHLSSIPLEMYFWWGLGAYSLQKYGYLKAIGGWKGEPLPPNLFRTWRRWSHRSNYFKPELEKSMQPNFYSEIRAPIKSWVFSDDPIATPTTARDILSLYSNAPTETEVLRPQDVGRKHIGHDGAFRQGNEILWTKIWNHLTEGLASV